MLLNALHFATVAVGSFQAVSALAPDPGEGKVYLGIWPDLSDGFYDTPAAANARLGHNFPVVQIAQSIPLPAYNYSTGGGGEALFSEVDATATDAAYFLTVYPDRDGGMTAVEDGDLVSMADQIRGYQQQGRTVFLRFAPEMGGSWMVYGLQPTLYKSLWERMYAIVKQIAPDTTIIWAPNTSYGYPNGDTLDDVESDEDRTALDTNGDGNLTSADNAYAPYYPGDDLVDQAGMSLYYKGPGFQNLNQPQPSGFCASLLRGEDPFYVESYTPFYDTYCDSPERPCVLTEAGAAYHVNVTGGSTQLEMQQAWIDDCLASNNFYDEFPYIRHIQMFEHAKMENDGGMQDYRDYRVTNETDILEYFQDAIESISDRFVWANSTLGDADETAVNSDVPTTPASSPNAGPTSTHTVTISSLSNEVVTATLTSLETPSYSGGFAYSDAEPLRNNNEDSSAGTSMSSSNMLLGSILLAAAAVWAM